MNILQTLWAEHQDLMVRNAELTAKLRELANAGDYIGVLAAEQENNDVLDKLHCDIACQIADTIPQTLEECLIHARLLAEVYCTEGGSWSRDQDVRLAKSLLAGLERLSTEGQKKSPRRNRGSRKQRMSFNFSPAPSGPG